MWRGIVGAFLLIAGLALFLGLGIWQLQRLEWKEAILADIAAQIGAEPGPLPALPTAREDTYRPVTLRGEMGTQELHVLVSSRDWGPGFRIISPFTTDDGRRIMVDRGFVPTAEKDAPRPGGPMAITGNLHWPQDRTDATPDDDPKGNWWYARNVAKMAAALGTEPVLVILRSGPDASVRPLPITTEGIRNKHFEYAMTWFLLAATWVVMTGFALWRIRRRNR
ncbi:MAG TPA: SURF1 family protein [Rhodobacterales bacterium]|nr:SURF1 family protein [Rhodobacterales bacterium]